MKVTILWHDNGGDTLIESTAEITWQISDGGDLAVYAAEKCTATFARDQWRCITVTEP